jgi:hypothetical protein
MCLILYSGVLSNLEAIDDPHKRRHLNAILEGWGYFVIDSLWLIPAIARDRRVDVDGIKYIAEFPKDFGDKKVARAIAVESLSSISDFMTTIFGTEKLENQLLQPDLTEQAEHQIITVFRTLLIADLRLRGWPSILGKTCQMIGNSEYFRENIVRKIRSIDMLGKHPENTRKQIRKIGGNLIGNIKRSHGADFKKDAARESQNLAKSELINRLKVNAQEHQSDEEEGEY